MTKREQQLSLIAGPLAFLVLVPLLYSLYGGSSSRVFAQRGALRKEVEELRQAVQKKDVIQKKLTEYRNQSLPQSGRTNQTRDRYYNLLLNWVRESGFQDFRLNPPGSTSSTTTRSNRTGFQTYSYKLTGTASLEGLTRLLREFYGAELLQLIKSLSITPVDQSNRMTIAMDIEAIALDTASLMTANWTPNPSSTENIQQLLGDQIRKVNDRALFSVYRPPTPTPPGPIPPQPPPEQDFTEAMHTFVGFISDVNGIYEVHLDRRLKGDKLRLKVDDRFEIDGVDCTVREIRFDRITIGIVDEDDPSEESRFTIRVGKSINEFDET